MGVRHHNHNKLKEEIIGVLVVVLEYIRVVYLNLLLQLKLLRLIQLLVGLVDSHQRRLALVVVEVVGLCHPQLQLPQSTLVSVVLQ